MYLLSNLIAKNLRENLRTTPARRPDDAHPTLDGNENQVFWRQNWKKETLR